MQQLMKMGGRELGQWRGHEVASSGLFLWNLLSRMVVNEQIFNSSDFSAHFEESFVGSLFIVMLTISGSQVSIRSL